MGSPRPEQAGLAAPSPRAGARIVGVGAARPQRSVTNAELEQVLATTGDWITTRTGITARRVAGPDETVVAMGAAAGAAALQHAGLSAADVDLVLVATSTNDYAMPQAAPRVAGVLGSNAGGYDVGAACAGFCFALAAAADAVRAGSARTVLVVGSERMTDLLEPTDRTMVPIFADGAGAVVVQASAVNMIGPLVSMSDGDRSGLIARAEGTEFLTMDGPAVFRWATTGLVSYAHAACDAAGVKAGELAGLVAHQANVRIIDALAAKLELAPGAVVARDIVQTGNTSAASIPLALAALLEDGDLPAGGALLLIGFGSGLSVAGQVVQFP